MASFVFSILFLVTSAEKISQVPGVDFSIYFDKYSGYLNVSETHRLFYWFVESQNTPSLDPLVFWFNGGPGCSSMIGFLNEHGPFLWNPENNTIKENDHSWNKIANVVYLETPAGVGYSYSTDGNVTTDDDLTANENYMAVKQFFKEFPQFRDHELFLAGQSYAGVFIPMLANEIINGQNEFEINLKGVAIGNGAFSDLLRQNLPWLYSYSHTFTHSYEYRNTIERCCESELKTCNPINNDEVCQDMRIYGGIDYIMSFDNYDISRKCFSYKMVAETNRSSCDGTFDLFAEKYLNSLNARKGFHVSDNISKWLPCNLDIYTRTKFEMAEYVKKIVQNQVRVLIYNGDQDRVCDFLTGQVFAADLNLKKLAPKSPWYFKGILAGYKTLYKGLTFTTIRGAGHSTPTTRPGETFHVIHQFFKNQDF